MKAVFYPYKLRVALKELSGAIRQAASAALQQAGEIARAKAQSTIMFRDRTGVTRKSVGFYKAGFHHGLLIARGAALFLNDGTKPHVILPKGAGMLRFQVNGRWVSTRKVNHPGTRARPFMLNARNFGSTALQALLISRVRDAIR